MREKAQSTQKRYSCLSLINLDLGRVSARSCLEGEVQVLYKRGTVSPANGNRMRSAPKKWTLPNTFRFQQFSLLNSNRNISALKQINKPERFSFNCSSPSGIFFLSRRSRFDNRVLFLRAATGNTRGSVSEIHFGYFPLRNGIYSKKQ